MNKAIKLLLLLFPIVFVAGCVQQTPTALGKGLDIKISVDSEKLFPFQETLLFIDVTNNDDATYTKLLVDLFNPGLLTISGAGLQKTAPTEEPSPVQINFVPQQPRDCRSSLECFDEEYGGCGTCVNGKCQFSLGSFAGGSCEKACQCGPGSFCSDGRCVTATGSSCVVNGKEIFRGSCGTERESISYYCDRSGEAFQQCFGLDRIPSDSKATSRADDCACPSGEFCRADGSCKSLEGNCFTSIYGFFPARVTSLACAIKAPSAEQLAASRSTNVEARIFFTKRFVVPQLIELISEQEFTRLQRSGRLVEKPRVYVYRDSYVQMTVEFNKELPYVVREGEKALMRVTIQNIGEGDLLYLRPDDFFVIEQKVDEDGKKQSLVKCDLQSTLRAKAGQLPAIVCDIVLPKSINVLENYITNIGFYYDYQIKKSIPIQLEK